METVIKEETVAGFDAKQLRRAMALKDAEKAAEAMRKREVAEKEEKERRDAFFSGEIKQEDYDRLWTRLQSAAEDGRTELLVGQFPSAWCTDRGRAINNDGAEWRDTLQGIAKTFVDYYDRELRSRDFKLRLEVINFPGGMPGDIGAFLSW